MSDIATFYSGGHILGESGRILGEYADLAEPRLDYCSKYDQGLRERGTSVYVGSNAVAIGDGCFDGMAALTVMIIASTVRRIGGAAFRGCVRLKELDLPCIVEIEPHTFYNCHGLERVHIPSSVRLIGEQAFRDCTTLAAIVLPEFVLDLGVAAFRGCRALRRMALPRQVTAVEAFTFYACRALAVVLLPDHLHTINACAFAFCTTLTELMLPDTLQTIGDNAFRGCHALMSINIPAGVTTVGEFAFRGCHSLASVSFPAAALLSYLPNGAFQGCTALVSICLPSSVHKIGGGAFSGCALLTAFSGPGLVRVGMSAFAFCCSLVSVSAASVEQVGHRAFAQCSAMVEYDVPPGLCHIEDSVFEGCASLVRINMHPNVARFGRRAFGNCAKLLHIQLPTGLQWVHVNAFDGCGSLSTVTIEARKDSQATQLLKGCSAFKNVPVRILLLESAAVDMVHFPQVDQIWATDAAIAQLGGRYSSFSTFQEVPAALRATNATSWAGAMLYMWWQPPSSFTPLYFATSQLHRRRLPAAQKHLIRAVALAASRSATAPHMPSEIWNYIFSF